VAPELTFRQDSYHCERDRRAFNDLVWAVFVRGAFALEDREFRFPETGRA